MFKTDRSIYKKDTEGRVYVFELILGNVTVYKVGICHTDRVVDRFMEVLKGFFTVYRFIPEARILKYRKFEKPLLIEKHLHKELEEYRYRFSKRFDGSTEFFTDIDIDYLLEYIETLDYHELLKCDSISTKDYETITKLLDTKDKPDETIPF